MTSPNPVTKHQETAIKKLRLPWRLIITGILAATSVFAYPTLRNVLLEDTSESTTAEESASLAIDKSKTTALPVRTLTLTPVTHHQEPRRYTGNIVAKRTSELGFERSGQLISLLVQEGQEVRRGTLIATLDTGNLEAQKQELIAQRAQATAKLQELQAGSRKESIAAAQAKVRDLREQLALAQSKYQRRLGLYQEGAITREQLEEVQTDVNAQQARIDQAQSELDELKAGTRPELISLQKAVIDQFDAQLKNINLEIEKSQLQAPYDGTIALLHVNIGTVVSASNPIVRLVESNKLEARIGVPIDQSENLPIGSKHRLKIGNKIVTGQVTSTLPQIDPTTRTATVILSLNQTQGLIPGQVVSLELSQSVPQSGYWLPTEALVQGTRGLWSSYVLGAANPDNPRQFTVKRQDLEVLAIQGDRLLVRGTLTSGDRVIVEGVHRIVPGQMVEIW